MGEYFVVFDGMWKVLNFWKVWLKKKKNSCSWWLARMAGQVRHAASDRGRLPMRAAGALWARAVLLLPPNAAIFPFL